MWGRSQGVPLGLQHRQWGAGEVPARDGGAKGTRCPRQAHHLWLSLEGEGRVTAGLGGEARGRVASQAHRWAVTLTGQGYLPGLTPWNAFTCAVPMT